jgi:hypothetical protein
MRAPTVSLYVRRRGSSDAPAGWGSPGEWGEPERVDGCLFAPGAPAGIGADRPDGARIEATAYFPRGYAGALRGAQVSVDREAWLAVVGDPQRFPAGAVRCPWDVQVLLETTEG